MTIRTESFAIELDDMVRLNMWKQRPFYITLFGIYGLFAFSALYAVGLPAPIAIACGIAATATLFALKPSQIRRRLSAPEYRAVFRSRIVELTDGVLRQMADDGTRSEIPLASFVRVERRLGSFLLFLTPDYYFAIPERAFREPSDREAFRTAILATIPKQAGF